MHEGGVAAVSGHMSRKMWGLIPVFDCTQLLLLCPSQCKPSVRDIPTTDSTVDPPQSTMAGEMKHVSEGSLAQNRISGLPSVRTRAARAAFLLLLFNLQKYREFLGGVMENTCCCRCSLCSSYVGRQKGAFCCSSKCF